MVRKSVRMYFVIAASARSGYIEKLKKHYIYTSITIFSYRYHQRDFEWRLFFTDGGFEVQRLYTLVLDSDSTKFVASESFWDLDYKINLLNSIRRSLKVKMIEA